MHDQRTNREISADFVVAAIGGFLMICGPSTNDNGSLLIAGSILVVGSMIAHAIRTNPPLLIRLPSKQFLIDLRNHRLRYSLRTLLIVMTIVAVLLGAFVIAFQ